MEMIFKLTEGKKPFIGVVFASKEEAEINKDLLLLKTEKTQFSIMIITYGHDSISFRLNSEMPDKIIHYNRVKMDESAFRKWRVYSHMKINFGHVIMVNKKPEVVRIDEKLFVLPISYFHSE